ncbi:MAG: DM13 domain-containing protein [Pseudomonadota bacterium]
MRALFKPLAAVFVAAMMIAPGAQAGETTVAANGTFTGASDHITTGGVSIVKTADGGAVVILDSDFSLDGAPDPRVGFGKDGTYVDASDLGELTSKTGLQVYVIPPEVNVADYNEVYIWCRKFAVPLGVASLN